MSKSLLGRFRSSSSSSLRKLSLVSIASFTLALACFGSGDGDDDSSANSGGKAGSGGLTPRAGSGGGGSGGGSGGTSNAGSGPGGDSGLAFPLTLTPLGAPNTSTAHVGLYFTVTDANDEPVVGLVDEAEGTHQFVATEDGNPIDEHESKFSPRPAKGELVIPTVLVLDLSASVVEAGALEDVKSAATSVIDSLDESQELAILTFAQSVTVRSPFSRDKVALQAAVDAITKADGISTNLYGAIQQGFNMWTQDGFYPYNGVEPQLVAGVVMIVSDGADTAALVTEEAAYAAMGNKRSIFINVGEGAQPEVAAKFSTTEPIDVSGGFGELDTAITQAIERLGKLNDAIYIAEYCSPKRAGTHDLLFTVAGNESYISGGGEPGASCAPAGYLEGTCEDVGYVPCDYSKCCPSFAPYYCSYTGECFETASEAAVDCGSSCIACGVTETPVEEPSSGGAAIDVTFTADGYSDAQCAALFDDGSGGAGNAGGTLADACSSLTTAAASYCGGPETGFSCGSLSFEFAGCSSYSYTPGCEAQFIDLVEAYAGDLASKLSTWSCEPVVYCSSDSQSAHPYWSCEGI